MTTITITNSIHNTEATVRLRDGRISRSQIQRLRRTLCGIAGCTCGALSRDGGAEAQAIIEADFALEAHRDLDSVAIRI